MNNADERDKAEQLVHRFANHSMGDSIESNKHSAINCAIIAVDEILANIQATMLYHSNSDALVINKKYWTEVRSILNEWFLR